MIYIDHLSLKTSILAYKLVRTEKNHGIKQSIQVLDPINNSLLSWLLQKGMRLFGISLYEANFFAGYLRTKKGDSIWITAKNVLFNIAHEVAKKTINSSKDLSDLNEQWGRNTLLLYLSKYYYRVAGYGGHHTIFKILIADALSRDTLGKKHHLVLGLPSGFNPDLFEDIRGPLNLYTYSIKEWSIKKTRLSVLLLITFISCKRFLKRIVNIFKSRPDYGDITTQALLLSQEDDLSMDRSYRGQPHWLFKENAPPKFRTLIMDSGCQRFIQFDRNELSEYNIYSVPKDVLYGYSEEHPIKKKINRAISTLLNKSIFGDSTTVDISFELALLFMKASLLSDLCISQNVKAFMTCENYYLDADVMNLVGPQMGIYTLSYQYSNLSEVGPIMMTTADTMCTFSPLYHDRWSNNGIQPKSFIDIGYLFDSSFCLVKERARELRDQLTKNDTKFIISYFDESVQDNNNKYGNVSINDHFQEIAALAKLVIQDPSIAVIVKTQFRRNTPSVMFEGDKIIESAKATGRFVDLLYGKQRNAVFPVQAAFASDLVISHAIGSTAALEAALTGCRCIVLNPYDMRGANIEIFKQADILYKDMDSALSAITLYRQGITEYRNLGNWGPIIDWFDPYRDGQSAGRMRKTIENVIF